MCTLRRTQLAVLISRPRSLWLIWAALLGFGACFEATPPRTLTYVAPGSLDTHTTSSNVPDSFEPNTLMVTPSTLVLSALHDTVPMTVGQTTLTVRALDANGMGIANNGVTLVIIKGVATLESKIGATDGNGIFKTTLTVLSPGQVGVRADVGGAKRVAIVTFTPACSTVTFASLVNISVNATGSAPMAVGDLDADGAYDLVVNGNANTLTLLHNSGNGNFITGATAANGDASLDGIADHLADMTGDGLADAVTSYYAVDAIGVWASDGNTGFSSWENFSYASDQRPTVGDIDADGLVDVAASSYYGGFVSVAFGKPTGGLGAATNYPLSASNDAFGSWTALGDFNNDGSLDMVVGNNNTTTELSVYINRGGRTFAPAQHYTVDSQPALVNAGDLNGDGAANIVVSTNNANPALYVLLSDGRGNFGRPQIYGTNNEQSVASLNDINGDGQTDLIVGLRDENAIYIYLNQGHGLFPANPLIIRTTAPELALATADFDGDGRIDIAVQSGALIAILQNTCQ